MLREYCSDMMNKALLSEQNTGWWALFQHIDSDLYPEVYLATLFIYLAS